MPATLDAREIEVDVFDRGIAGKVGNPQIIARAAINHCRARCRVQAVIAAAAIDHVIAAEQHDDIIAGAECGVEALDVGE